MHMVLVLWYLYFCSQQTVVRFFPYLLCQINCVTISVLNKLWYVSLHMCQTNCVTIFSLPRCQTYEGGFSGCPGMEAHGGYSFCGVAALTLLNKTNHCDIKNLLVSAV